MKRINKENAKDKDKVEDQATESIHESYRSGNITKPYQSM